MASRFTKPTINWKELEKRVPVEQRVNFFAFKGKSDGYLRRVLANPPEPPAINWEEYRKVVPVEGLVDKFKAEYEKYKVPYPGDGGMIAQIDEQWKALQPEVNKYCDEVQKDIDKAKKELDRIKSLPKMEEMTMEMVAEMFPEQALDPIKRPTFWPHNPEEQPSYKPPAAATKDAQKKK